MSRVISPVSIFKLRMLYAALPAALIISVLWYAILGEQGLLRYHMLQQNLIAVRSDIQSIDTSNKRLRDLVEQHRKSPRKIQLQAVERLLHAPDGSKVFRFHP